MILKTLNPIQMIILKLNVPDINNKLNGSQLFINPYENDFNLYIYIYIYIYICYIWIFLLYYI